MHPISCCPLRSIYSYLCLQRKSWTGELAANMVPHWNIKNNPAIHRPWFCWHEITGHFAFTTMTTSDNLMSLQEQLSQTSSCWVSAGKSSYHWIECHLCLQHRRCRLLNWMSKIRTSWIFMRCMIGSGSHPTGLNPIAIASCAPEFTTSHHSYICTVRLS